MIAYESYDFGSTTRIRNSRSNYIQSSNIQDLLNFMLEPHLPVEFLVVWNLENFMAPILKRLPIEYLKRLCDRRQVWIKESGHSITYNPKKSVHLTLGSNRANYYQLGQFFNGQRPKSLQDLESMGKKLLNELKTIGIEPVSLSSPVTVIKELLEEIKYPNCEELPDEVGQLAWDCCGRPWVEAHKIGHWDKAYDYDIISSFPSACAELLDLRYGKWIESSVIPQKAYYGFAKGKVNITSAVSPIVYTNRSGKLFNPKGKWNTSLTLQEIRFIDKYKLGSFKIESGWWWIAKEVKITPFKELIKKLYEHRQQSELLNLVMKKSMVALYGKFLQTFDDGERLDKGFNPVYGAVIETDIRLKVAKFILDNKLEDNVIHISTDGCLLDKRVMIENGDMMGSWRLDSSGPALVVSSGCLFYGDKRPNQIMYPEAMKMIKANSASSSWGKKSKRVFTVGFGLKNQHDRDFGKLPSSGTELLENHYQSQPYSVRKLSKSVEQV